MNTQELYDYIDGRIESITTQENTYQNLGMISEATACVIVKNELADLRSFVKSNERKLKS